MGRSKEKYLNTNILMKLELNVKEKSVQYLHGIALAVHSVLRAGDRGAVTPVQVELQALVCLRQISS